MEKNNALPRNQTLRDSQLLSPWQKGPYTLNNAADIFEEANIYDALIVGGGITGLTTALMLQKQGKQCVLAEAYTIGYGTTGGTSAHLNTFFDATYAEVDSDFGEDGAKLLAKCGKEAFALITDNVKQYNIDCDLEYKDGYLYAETDEEVKMLGEIMSASQRAGIKVEEATKNGLNVPFIKSIVFKEQGQFHPLKYIFKLAEAFVGAGGVILENTFIRDSSYEDGVHSAQGDTIKIKAKNLVYATHLPPGINVLNFKCAPYRSYVLGLRLGNENAYTDALSYDSKDPYHYFRSHIIDGKKYMIVGGEDHKTGHDDPEAAYETLEQYVRQYYDVAEVSFKWSSQYYVPADGLPYIGKLPAGYDNMYIATGFNGNGMTFGTISGKMISDAILGKENEYFALFSPSRIKPVAGFMEFVKENADVAYRFIADRLTADSIDSLKEIEAGTGSIVKYQGEKLAVYKDAEGKVTALNPVCTHAKCIVCFNPAETSWDCPCHGGRFDIDGKVLTGPPRTDLQKVTIL
ncbi:FAD-dependent oxidoreductase [Mucilaginibacter sp. ZT4R22]|uniref:FAD-dependent oxidoreductase n=1 Tax=Mucilaginibacter pankratovii TaxID=2772110 RepID=A0ABR7WIU4_9SPHI|nr:FAD-dependent oxidoreductase [Mucilaginibacter pankratovii]MBD1362250.1 FAD-dependent oxidoreductase [Mucilaginibacter pankratovii]